MKLQSFFLSFLFLSLHVLAQTSQSPPVIDSPGVSSIPEAVTKESLEKEETPDFILPQKVPRAYLGRFRKRVGNTETVEIEALLLNRYKNSVVRVRALDGEKAKLGEAMGVAVGLTASGTQVGESIYIATSLSLILGNDLQWADQVEIEHYSGTKYNAQIAIINEELDIVLLKPRNYPQAIRFVQAENERSQLDVISISFQDNLEGGFEAISHPAVMAAINSEDGTLSISGSSINNTQAGTAILNMQGQLMGMLLPGSQGVLSSSIYALIKKAQKKETIPPVMLGVIMGRGVLVDKSLASKGVYTSIEAALKDIKLGKAPKADPSRFLQAKTERFRPKAPSRTLLKVAPGTYRLKKALEVPSNISIAGSGSQKSILTVQDPKESVLLLKRVKNVFISNFQIKPGEKQGKLQSTIFIQDSTKLIFLGNLIESSGGRALHSLGSKLVSVVGNAFPKGANKAIYCQKSYMKVEANSFLGAFPQALAIGKDCSILARRNLFMESKVGVAISSKSSQVQLKNNTFIHAFTGVRFYGDYPKLEIGDNIFYKGRFSFFMTRPFRASLFGKNSSWKSVAFLRKRRAEGLQFIKGQPIFKNPSSYDFRLEPGTVGFSSGSQEDSGDMGAFQSSDFLGEYTAQFLITLEAATGEKGLAEKWGYK